MSDITLPPILKSYEGLNPVTNVQKIFGDSSSDYDTQVSEPEGRNNKQGEGPAFFNAIVYANLIKAIAHKYVPGREEGYDVGVTDEESFLISLDKLMSEKLGNQVENCKGDFKTESTMIKQEIKVVQELMEKNHRSVIDYLHNRRPLNHETRSESDDKLISTLMKLIKNSEGLTIGKKILDQVFDSPRAFDKLKAKLTEKPPKNTDEYRKIIKMFKPSYEEKF